MSLASRTASAPLQCSGKPGKLPEVETTLPGESGGAAELIGHLEIQETETWLSCDE